MSERFLIGALSLVFASTLCVATQPRARANSEPSAFDARSVGLATTGAAYLDTPAALVVNPANLMLLENGAIQATFQPIFVRQWAPVEAPDTRSESSGFGPLFAAYASARVHPRIVLGFGVYTTTGYSSGFTGVERIASAELDEPRDISARFFSFEASAAAAIRLHDRFFLGFGLRVPYAQQGAALYQELFPATGGWGYIEQDLAGVGYPGGRFGIHIRAHEKLTLGVSYRTKIAVPMSGTATVDLGGGMRIEDIEMETRWHSPHALQAGLAFRTYGGQALLAADYRLQLHQAVNQVQYFETSLLREPIEAPFYFNNVHALRLGMEIAPNPRLALRAGISRGLSATSKEGLQFFTPPPGPSGSMSFGVGLRFRQADLDMGLVYTHAGKYIEHDEERCGPGNRIKTHCGGQYGVRTIQLSISATRRFTEEARPKLAPFSERRAEERAQRTERRGVRGSADREDADGDDEMSDEAVDRR
ncbi:MAG: hypothetical protein GX614_09565 [Sandaracinaceae bacterium]|nr:hypothetical protein [Sandaracinaceae bacterium]